MWIVSHLTGGAEYSIRGSEVMWALRGGTLRLCNSSEGVKWIVELGYFSPIKCLVRRVKTVKGIVID